jgi:hypothetical protein
MKVLLKLVNFLPLQISETYIRRGMSQDMLP